MVPLWGCGVLNVYLHLRVVLCPVLLFFYVAALCVVAVAQLNSSIMDAGRGAVILRIIEDAPSVFYNQQSMSCLIHSHM